MRINLGQKSYDVSIGIGLLDEILPLVRPAPSVQNIVLLEDPNAGRLYGDRVASALGAAAEVHRLTLGGGESSKSLEAVERVLEEIANRRVRRNDLVVTLGGGVASDLGAFVASIYQRGISVCHIPTTLLAQVDAAIGGKTGVNLAAGKNLAGTFHHPVSVIADVTTLQSLPEREFRSGVAEVIKYALVFDPRLLQALLAEPLQSSQPERLEEVVHACAALKAVVVESDELDQSGRRASLNYGHTVGHALEAIHGFDGMLHGEAISVGMVVAAELAGLLGMLDPESIELHRTILERAGLPTSTSVRLADIEKLLQIDKKHEKSQRWVLLDGLGNARVVEDVAWENLESAFGKVRA